MKFKKMEIYGFKSFADKMEVKFESGVTGIVGPNGCGKSNVADSIRWVLGEQSAKALRGSSMQDVIFNGTEKRKSQSFAEVGLYFDNTDKIFPNLDYDEVVISRKLYRSGESEYSINKTPCRLKDVVESLRDSGLGKESYSIIGQGRIDEILSAKPEERRAVFEEAAGISKLKNRKTEAEKKLEHTHDNLIRLNDIINELEIQLGPLKKQSENAKKYLEFHDQLKSLEINTYIYQYESASSSKEIINDRLNGINEEIELKENEFNECLNNYNTTLDEIHKLDDNIETLRDELLTLTVGLEKQAGESKLIQEKIAGLEEQNKRLNNDILSNSTEYSQYETLITGLENEEKIKQDIVEELSRKIDNATAAYLAIVDKITASEEHVESSTGEVIEALEFLSDVKADMSSLKTEKTNIIIKQKEISDRKDEITGKIKTYQNEVDEITGNLLKYKNEKRETIIKSDKKTEEYNSTTKKIIGLEDKLSNAKAEYHSSESRRRLLEEMQKQDEGYVSSVKRILQDSKTNASLGGKVVGVVAKLVKVPQKYESAIEMALGSAVQNIVTHDEEDAKNVIEYLKEQKIGRATFMPLTSIKPHYIDKEYNMIVASHKGSFGVATDLVSFDKKLAPVFDSLLGGTVVVDNLDNAVELAKKCRYSFKIVTLDGDVINPQGTLTGGSKKFDGVSIIGRDREIQDLAKKTQIMSGDIDSFTNELNALKVMQSELVVETKELSEFLHQEEMNIVKESDKLSKIKSFVAELTEEIDHLEKQYKMSEKRFEVINQALNKTSEKEKEISDKKDTASESKRQKNSEFDELKRKREQYYNELTELKVNKASAESECQSISENIVRSIKAKENLNYSIKERKLALQINLSEVASLQKKFEEVVDKNQYNDNIKALQAVRDKLANLDGFKDELNLKLAKYDESKLLVSGEISRANDKKYKEEMALSKIDSDIEIMQERVFEEYGLTYTTSLPFRVEAYNLEEGLSESGRLKRAIQHLGYVNVNAIEQLNEVSERYTDLSTQRDDLVAAETDLNKIIKELSVQMEDKFKTEFEKINKNFQIVFKELFDGGRSELRMHEDEPLLEAGIEIVAEPPGKKLQSISLLSGGERAMTAIAILFAILKLRPMPFCVLDEIEAALDDANAERFAKYLKRFSKNTQFIVITHRKPTMELADTLYGVTMEEKGVSKMVSVQLSDAVKNSSEEVGA